MIHLSTVSLSEEAFRSPNDAFYYYTQVSPTTTTTNGTIMPTTFRVYGQHLLWSRQIIVIIFFSLPDLWSFCITSFFFDITAIKLGWAFKGKNKTLIKLIFLKLHLRTTTITVSLTSFNFINLDFRGRREITLIRNWIFQLLIFTLLSFY